MPNIFDGLNKMDDEKLKYQIATLKAITVINITGEIGQKAKKQTVKLTNTVRGIFNKNKFEEPKVISIENRIVIEKNKLDGLSRFDLDYKMKNILLEKIKSAGTSISRNPSNDELSIAVIETAAKCYKKEIEQYLSPAQKADAVRYRYNEKLLIQTRKNLEKQTVEERKRTEEEIQRKIEDMSIKQQEELKNALGVDQLTGKTVSKMLATVAGGTAAMVALEVSGFGAYIALTTIMRAIFTTTLGITLPFAAYTGATSALAFITGPAGWIALAGVEVLMLSKSKNKLIYELMAQVVWGSVESYGKKFTPSDEELPSWLPHMERDAANKESLKLLQLIKENELIKEKHKNLKHTMIQNEEKIRNYNIEIEKLKRNSKEEERINKINQQDMMELKRKLEATESIYREQSLDANQVGTEEYNYLKMLYENIKSELKNKEMEIKNTEKLVVDSWEEIDRKEKEIKQLDAQAEEKDNESKELSDKIKELEKTIDMRMESKSRSLKQRWNGAFNKIEFHSSVYREVSKNFQDNELGSIEIRLYEINGTNDPQSLYDNRGKMNDGRSHIPFEIPSGFPGRIFYRVNTNNYKGKKVTVSEISKHNDSRHGK